MGCKMACVMCLTSWETFSLKKKSITWHCHWFLPYMCWNHVFLLFFGTPLPRCQKTDTRFSHTPLPPHAYTNSCHVWFCGIWSFERNDFLIFHRNRVINFTTEDCVHVPRGPFLISNAWGRRGKRWRAVLRESKVSHRLLTILSCLRQRNSQCPWILTTGLGCGDLRKYPEWHVQMATFDSCCFLPFIHSF